METPPLRVGNVLFADGNAAARTFGRAHRHRPYHFSCGSCHKVAGEVLAADIPNCLSQENSSPHHKHECIVVANSSSRHKH